MSRGILGTHYAKLKPGVTKEQVDSVYRDFYADEPFVDDEAPLEEPVEEPAEGELFPEFDEEPTEETAAAAAIGVAKAAHAKAKAMLAYTQIKSPFKGVVTQRHVDVDPGGVAAQRIQRHLAQLPGNDSLQLSQI